MEPDEICPRIFEELAEIIATNRKTGQKKAEREQERKDSDSYRLVNLTSIPGKVLEKSTTSDSRGQPFGEHITN